jgi:hypothetical protein
VEAWLEVDDRMELEELAMSVDELVELVYGDVEVDDGIIGFPTKTAPQTVFCALAVPIADLR